MSGRPNWFNQFNSFPVAGEAHGPKPVQQQPRRSSSGIHLEIPMYPPMNPAKKLEWSKLVPHVSTAPRTRWPPDSSQISNARAGTAHAHKSYLRHTSAGESH
eukprot:CAMPEP_0197032372 /NCGR_PEP_ID=MMETSP1384-20130603/11064_1 /TAXON_ID=29189 /ORGANISM="Ammonia sp." /LENGTH=101 /DNA_ID=CAMNT_0042462021 /DNA_START=106 /DNA_END=411 /DNA_ORIENTATION=-